MNTSVQQQVKYTEEEYFALDEEAEKEGKRYEYHDGEIFLISDDIGIHFKYPNYRFSNHNTIVDRCVNMISNQSQVQIFDYTHSVFIEKETFISPDIVAVYGNIQTMESQQETITNPTVIIEILSPETVNYDRGEKFQLYRKIPSLKEYVCISAISLGVEKYTRKGLTEWLLQEYISIEDFITLESIDVKLSLSEIYEKIDFKNEKIVDSKK